MNVWRLMAHWEESEKVVAWAKREGRVAIGWNPGNVLDFESPEKISARVRIVHPQNANWPISGKQLWDFSRTIEKDDLVILNTAAGRVAVMQITGEYEYHAEMILDKLGKQAWPYMLHQRKAKVVNVSADALWKLAGGCADGYSARWTLIRCKNPVTNTDLRLRL